MSRGLTKEGRKSSPLSLCHGKKNWNTLRLDHENMGSNFSIWTTLWFGTRWQNQRKGDIAIWCLKGSEMAILYLKFGNIQQLQQLQYNKLYSFSQSTKVSCLQLHIRCFCLSFCNKNICSCNYELDSIDLRNHQFRNVF